MKSIIVFLVAAVSVVGAAVAQAQVVGPVRDPGVNTRQIRQHARIKQGVRSGELTRQEVQGLAQEQRAIRQEERAYKSDGKLTPAERRDLHQDMNQASRDIYQQKHDEQTR